MLAEKRALLSAGFRSKKARFGSLGAKWLSSQIRSTLHAAKRLVPQSNSDLKVIHKITSSNQCPTHLQNTLRP